MNAPQPPRSLYGPVQGVWLALCLLVTRLLFRPCRLIRLPIFLRGRRHIVFGRRFVCGYMVRLDAFGGPGCLVFGDDVQLNDFVHIGSVQRVSIGHGVMIASRVFITDHDHGRYAGDGEHSPPDVPPEQRSLAASPVKIGDRVWIGENVSVLPGAVIGNGAVIGANSVVKGHIPPDSIAVGVPARVIKRFDAASGRWTAVTRA